MLFIFLAFWPFPWQRQPFWKGTTSHGMIFLQVFIKFDLGIFEKCVRQTFDGRKKERRRRIITRYDTVFEIKW